MSVSGRITSFATGAGAVLAGVLIVVFSTYGTLGAGNRYSGTIYAMFAIPACVLLCGIILSIRFALGKGLPIAPVNTREFGLFAVLLILLPMGVIQLPEYAKTAFFVLFMSIVILGVMASTTNSEERIRGAVRFYQTVVYLSAWLALIAGLYSMNIGSLSLGPIHIEHTPMFRRMNSWFNNSTMLGIFFAHAIFAVYYFCRRSSSAWRIVFHSASGISFVIGMVLSGGRTGIILCAMAFFWITIVRVWRRPAVAVWVFLLMTGIALGFAWASAEYKDIIFILRRFQGDDVGDLGGRGGFASMALEELTKAPIFALLFGYGINGVKDTLEWSTSIHSGMLRIMLEHGLIFVFVYSALLISILVRIFFSRSYIGPLGPESESVSLSLVGFFAAEVTVIQLFGVDFFYVMFLTIFGAYLSMVPHWRRDQSSIQILGEKE